MSVCSETGLSFNGSELKVLRVIELALILVASSKVGLGLSPWFGEGGPSCSGKVVLGVVVGMRHVHGFATVTARFGFSGLIMLGNQREVKSSCCEVVFDFLKVLLREHSSGLFSNSLSNMLVSCNVGSVTGIAWN